MVDISYIPLCEQTRNCVWYSGAQGRGGEVLVWTSLTPLKCIWRSVKKEIVQGHLLCSVFCSWGKGASVVVKELEQCKCKSTCETSKIIKPVAEDSG